MEHNYDDPSYLVNIFKKEWKKLSPEERKEEEEKSKAFMDWMLLEESDNNFVDI